MAEPIRLTAAEEEALRYLTKGGRRDWYTSALASMYRRRFEDAAAAEGRVAHVGGARQGSWRRTSGAVFARLRRKGVLRQQYGRLGRRVDRCELTEAGAALVAALGDQDAAV
jgi:hypothetical protein